jgi:hypothetical protein
MKIRLTRGAYAGLVCDHSPHAAHELIKRGLAERVDASPAVEVAVTPPPPEVERATKKHRRHRA